MKKRIGFYSDASGYGGSETNLKIILEEFDYDNYEVYFQVMGFQEEPLSIMQHCDISVLPSIAYETFGIVNIEAMACGKPVVATALSGIPEVVIHNETGLIVPPRDSAALAQAILLLLQDDVLRARYGEQGRALVHERNSKEAMMASIFDVLEECSQNIAQSHE